MNPLYQEEAQRLGDSAAQLVRDVTGSDKAGYVLVFMVPGERSTRIGFVANVTTHDAIKSLRDVLERLEEGEHEVVQDASPH